LKNNTPVIIFNFKKWAHLRQIYTAVNNYSPCIFYIVVDQSNSPNEDVNRAKIIDEINRFSFSIPVEIIEPDKHLGITKIIQFGLNQAFKMTEKVIVLEDDTVPSMLFFSYCDKMLNQFEGNSNVGCINGSNLGIKGGKKHYFKSRVSLPFWGWATWKNRWEKFPNNYDFWVTFRVKESNSGVSIDSLLPIFDRFVKKDKSWDVKWTMYLLANNLITIFPGENLISNVGFTKDATFTNISNSKFSNLAIEESTFEEVDFEKEIEMENEYLLKMKELIQELGRRESIV